MPRIKIHIELLDDQGNHMVNDLETGATDKQDAEYLISRAVFGLTDTVKRMLDNPVYVKIEVPMVPMPSVPMQPITWPPAWDPNNVPVMLLASPYVYDTGSPLQPVVTINSARPKEDPGQHPTPTATSRGADALPDFDGVKED